MPVGYDPAQYWAVLFVRKSSVFPLILARSVGLLCLSGVVVVIVHLQPEAIEGMVDGSVLLPFQMIVAFVIGFRLNSAYDKYSTAHQLVLDLHADVRTVVNRLSTYLPDDQESHQSLEEIRRLLVLACVLMKKHVRVENDFQMELSCGLITAEEHEALSAVATVASHPGGDGKKDKYPSRNRPSFAMYYVSKRVAALYRAGKLMSAPHAVNIDGILDHLAQILEHIEFIGLTIVPLPYAQLTRWIALVFLMLIPFKVGAGAYEYSDDAVSADVLCAVVSFASNMIYFAIDEVATQLEAPFGRKENDVDFEKMLRRIDKHTAAQLSLRLGRAVPNFDLFPSTRKTSASHEDLAFGRSRRSLNIYELQREASASRLKSERFVMWVLRVVYLRCSWRMAALWDRATGTDKWNDTTNMEPIAQETALIEAQVAAQREHLNRVKAEAGHLGKLAQQAATRAVHRLAGGPVRGYHTSSCNSDLATQHKYSSRLLVAKLQANAVLEDELGSEGHELSQVELQRVQQLAISNGSADTQSSVSYGLADGGEGSVTWPPSTSPRISRIPGNMGTGRVVIRTAC
mmetsp:Transcript_90880/g.272937  ORF Transcript_90880/g.272937 Transcript_90880/m.272937 type:complete len:573 (-) Transcript_90880:189-1907(-)